MIINCTYGKTLYRDEKTGDTKFTVIPQSNRELLNEYGNILCRGIIPNYPAGLPIELNLSESEDGIYKIWTSKIKAYDYKSVSNFLTSGYFPGIGPVKAKEYLDTYGIDIFSNDKKPKFECIYELTRGYVEFQKLITLINSLGGNYHNAYRLYKKFGLECNQIFEETPYKACGTVPFKLIDRYALRTFDRFNKNRIKAILKEGFRVLESRGDTCSDVGEFCKIIASIDASVNPLYVMGGILDEKEFHFKEKEFKVYDSQLYMCEENIAFNLSRMEACKKFLGEIRTDIIEEIEREESIVYGESQLSVFDLLKETGTKIITGGPGTGKTTVINGIIKYIQKVFKSHFYFSPR